MTDQKAAPCYQAPDIHQSKTHILHNNLSLASPAGGISIIIAFQRLCFKALAGMRACSVWEGSCLESSWVVIGTGSSTSDRLGVKRSCIHEAYPWDVWNVSFMLSLFITR